MTAKTALTHVATAPLPFGERFVGQIVQDGQRVHVAAIALDTDGSVIFLSLVGPDTSVSAVAAALFLRGQNLNLALAVGDTAIGGFAAKSRHAVCRLEGEAYHQIIAPVPGTREKNLLIVPAAMDLSIGLQFPLMPDPPAKPGATAPQPSQRPPRYIMAATHGDAPAPEVFFGHCKCLNLPVLREWMPHLFELACHNGLITPLQRVANVTVWQMDGNPKSWYPLLAATAAASTPPSEPPADL